ncbi:hypothetical protein EBZ37_11625 [bacterium]|nr:hypothetical protein [bacterium]
MSKNIPESADAISGDTPRSAQEKLAHFQLMREKLEAASSENANVRRVLGNLSEKEKIIHGVLTKIAAYSESSPEYAQLEKITGRSDRLEIAEFIGEQVWRREANKKIFATFTPEDAAAAIGTGAPAAGGLLGVVQRAAAAIVGGGAQGGGGAGARNAGNGAL